MFLGAIIKIIRHIFLLLFFLLLTACANKTYITKSDKSIGYPSVERPVAGCMLDERAFDCDRRAILSMLGEYQVAFNFHETAVLKSGYVKKDPKHSGGFEVVVLADDSNSRISMQHILVGASGMKIKHWRQEWVYEKSSHWVYVGNQRFDTHNRKPVSVPGTWTQLVYEVNDGPRYAGRGRWNHRYGVSTWTSERTWRPLPRREYSKRSDYQLLNVENRHTITPQGWTHEQDNTKVMRKNGKDIILVREFGFNDYRRITGFDFSPGLDYWEVTSPFWALVRKRWDSELDKEGETRLLFITGDEKFSDAVLSLADAFHADPNMNTHLPTFEAVFKKYVNSDISTTH
jgi:hypothetical protein